MAGPILVLGSNPIQIGAGALVESENADIDEIEKLLAEKPRAAVITSGGEGGFFRASLCLERGVSRVVLRRGVFGESWERELAARAATFGAELYVHDDSRGYGQVKPGARISVGIPDSQQWTLDNCGMVVDADLAEQVRHAKPLNMDRNIEGLPSNLEEVAFVNGDKPVLYLVLPIHEVEFLSKKYVGATIVRREIPLAVESATGRRTYDGAAGQTRAHVFISQDSALAQRAASLWDEGSTRHVVAIGELMGYPSCCVAAFAALGERGNNAALTYVTYARSRAFNAPFFEALNSQVCHVIPFTPCTFGCARAEKWAERVIDALPTEIGAQLCRDLARPVLYFDESRCVVFEGARVQGNMIEYEEARFVSPSAPLVMDEELAARRLFGFLLRGSGKLFVKENEFEIVIGDSIRRIPRIGAKLGIVLPFGGANHSA